MTSAVSCLISPPILIIWISIIFILNIAKTLLISFSFQWSSCFHWLFLLCLLCLLQFYSLFALAKSLYICYFRIYFFSPCLFKTTKVFKIQFHLAKMMLIYIFHTFSTFWYFLFPPKMWFPFFMNFMYWIFWFAFHLFRSDLGGI